MPKLEPYDRALPYSYALGIFPAMECLSHAKDCCLRLLISSESQEREGISRLVREAEDAGIRVEAADRMLSRLAKKGNCYAAMVYRKRGSALQTDTRHLVLHHPSDAGNLGTIFRAALGFGYRDVAIIRPAVDPDDPHVVRASMGACFSLRIASFDAFEDYRSMYTEHRLFPFMLTGSVPLDQAVQSCSERHALIMGNEATGLPAAFSSLGTAVRIPHSDAIDSLNLGVAASIGMYAFSTRKGE